MRISDWSSDVCSSDLARTAGAGAWRHALSRRNRRHAAYNAGQDFARADGSELYPCGRAAAGEGGCARHFVHGKAAIGRNRTEALSRGSLRSEEHTSELQSLMRISYAVFCLKKKR